LPTNRFARRTPTSLAIAALLLAACPSLAMQVEDDDPKPLLAGPSVDARPDHASLVHRDFSGQFLRLDRHPAEAALDLVRERFAPDEDSVQAIEAILAERRKTLDDLVVDRLDVLIKLSNGGNEDDRAEAIAALRQAMAPIARKGQLGDRIRRHLSAEAATEHQRLEHEYVEAAIEDRVAMLQAEGGAMAERGLRMRARAIETLVGLGAEVKGAYERTIVQQGQRIDELIALLKLSPEQDGKVRRIIQEFGEKTLLSKEARDDASSRLAVFLEVAAELTPEQRRTLLEHARGER
jgi:hypothetical protein